MHRRVFAHTIFCLLAIASTSCLGRIERDRDAEQVALAPREQFGLALHDSRPYWLLRSDPGWKGAHEIRYGGDPEDTAVAVVRAVRFADEAAAQRGFARLSPDYLLTAYRDRMITEPRVTDYPLLLAGDQVVVYAYGVRLPAEIAAEVRIYGQQTAVRAGLIVMLVESIGVIPERLAPAIEALVAAAAALNR